MTTIEVITRLRILANVFRNVGHDDRETTCRQAASELEAFQKEVAELKAENTSMRDREKIEPNYCFACGGTGGHQEGCLGITGLALAQSERDSFRTQNQKLREALKNVIASASPHPMENGAMYEAWQTAKQALATQPEKP